MRIIVMQRKTGSGNETQETDATKYGMNYSRWYAWEIDDATYVWHSKPQKFVCFNILSEPWIYNERFPQKADTA